MADDLKGEGDRIARLLDDVRGMAGPTTWQRVEELVQRVVRLYGAGLARVLELAAETGALDDALRARLCEDELVASLLLLHGLHPEPPAERVERAVLALRAQLGPDVALELVALGDDGVVTLRLRAAKGGCPSTGAALARAIEQHVVEAAPEVTRVVIEGVPATTPRPEERLVTLGRPRAAEGAAP
ncbi:MAG: NifU family protein [Anaeromyxobacteraceae bacterium]